MDPEKVKVVTDWPRPKSVKDVQQFLGMANYYRRFIEKFAETARPLHDLTQKDKKWDWNEKAKLVFETLKNKFTTAPLLAVPDRDRKF